MQALEKSEGVPGTHCLLMRGSPGFSVELGNYCICLHVARSYIIGSLVITHNCGEFRQRSGMHTMYLVTRFEAALKLVVLHYANMLSVQWQWAM